MKKWFLYVVECADETLYTGITVDINRRLREHNFTQKGAKYTRSRRPVKLVSIIEVDSRSGALKAEARFKKLTRQEKLRQIREMKSNEDN
tara:strand:+ start:18755 stop:19024 length:270 start_codon:yes stop_codon:yes gene_type:complete